MKGTLSGRIKTDLYNGRARSYPQRKSTTWKVQKQCNIRTSLRTVSLCLIYPVHNFSSTSTSGVTRNFQAPSTKYDQEQNYLGKVRNLIIDVHVHVHVHVLRSLAGQTIRTAGPRRQKKAKEAKPLTIRRQKQKQPASSRATPKP